MGGDISTYDLAFHQAGSIRRADESTAYKWHPTIARNTRRRSARCQRVFCCSSSLRRRAQHRWRLLWSVL